MILDHILSDLSHLWQRLGVVVEEGRGGGRGVELHAAIERGSDDRGKRGETVESRKGGNIQNTKADEGAKRANAPMQVWLN